MAVVYLVETGEEALEVSVSDEKQVCKCVHVLQCC